MLIKRLNSLLTLEKMETAIQSVYPRFDGAKNVAIAVAGPLDRDLGTKTEENRNQLIRLVKHYIFSTLEWIMDTLMNVLMLTDVMDGDVKKLERQMIKAMQFTALMAALSFLSSWLGTLTAYTGSILATATIFSVAALALTTFGVIYVKYLKPAPAHLHPATNLTELAIKKELPTAMFREEATARIVALWRMNATTENFRLYPLLVGESGVGKSIIFNEVAKHILEGKDPILKNLNVYSVNANNLVDGQGVPEHWELIQKNLEGFEKKSGVFVDEIHGAFRETGILGNLLLTSMDTTGGMPFMAFACTKEDYENYLKDNPSFLRRVEKIAIESLSNEETYISLANEIKKDAPDVYISDEVLKKVSYLSDIENCRDAFAGCPQPVTSKRILYTAIAKTHLKKLDEQLKPLLLMQSKRQLIDSKWGRLNNPPPYDENAAELFEEYKGANGLDQEILRLQAQVDEANLKLSHFKSLQKTLDDVTLKFKLMSLDISHALKNNKSTGNQLREFLLRMEYYKKALENAVGLQRIDLGGIYPEITVEDITKFIEEEAVNLKAKEKNVQLQLNSLELAST